jgi:DNA-binding FrmR family transcriptional regulator
MTDMATQEQLCARLRRIEGQIRGIAKMLEGDRTCEEVVTQLMAVRSAVDTVGALMLDHHLGRCTEGREPEAQIDALRNSMRLWWKFAPGASGFGGVDQPAPTVPGLGD